MLLGKTAELLWTRRVGLATGWLAALYWPLILFEATYYCEAFAIFNLTLALFLIVKWSRKDATTRLPTRFLFWAGFALGWSILARANAMLCLPFLVAWVAWREFRGMKASRFRRLLTSTMALLLPTVLLCLPVLYWNWTLTGRPMLRTGGWLSVYLGNNPEYRALVVPAGVLWRDFVYQPIRADQVEISEQEDYWRSEVKRVVQERTGDWLKLMERKALMLAARFEVSQEIDIEIFRGASPVFALPVWPGWGTLVPLAILCVVAMVRSPEARRGLPLLLCAIVYFASAAPVQVCARYRLPVVVPLLPLAGWALVYLLDLVRRRDARALVQAAAVILASGLLVWPDWVGLGQEKIINHSFLVGKKRVELGDPVGAMAAFEAGAAWNPSDPDCPLELGLLWLERGEVDKAEVAFRKSQENFPGGYDAVLGLGRCALAQGKHPQAMEFVANALKLAPNNKETLELMSAICFAAGDWAGLVSASRQLRSYPTHPASVAFNEAWALTKVGDLVTSIPLYDSVAKSMLYSDLDRARAAFLAGAQTWRMTHDRTRAYPYWQQMHEQPPTFFQPLGALLTGTMTTTEALALLPAEMQVGSRQYVEYALGLRSWMDRDAEEAQRHFRTVLELRNARALQPGQQNILEIWAISELSHATAPEPGEK